MTRSHEAPCTLQREADRRPWVPGVSTTLMLGFVASTIGFVVLVFG